MITQFVSFMFVVSLRIGLNFVFWAQFISRSQSLRLCIISLNIFYTQYQYCLLKLWMFGLSIGLVTSDQRSLVSSCDGSQNWKIGLPDLCFGHYHHMTMTLNLVETFTGEPKGGNIAYPTYHHLL